MKLTRIDIENFMSHESTSLDLSAIETCAIVGANGAGKSTILEAIMWALFGTAKLANKDLIRLGCSSTRVALQFELDGQDCEITRAYEEGSMKVTFLVAGESVADGSKLRTDEIVRRIGSSRELLLQSVVVSQGQLSNFIEAKPAERRDLIAEMLLLARYQHAHEEMRDGLRALESATSAYRTTIDSIENQISKIPLAIDLNFQITTITQQLTDVASKIESEGSRRTAFVVQEREHRVRLEQLDKQTVNLNERRVRQTQEFDTDLNEIEASIRRTDNDVETLPKIQETVAKMAGEIQIAEQISQELQTRRTQHEGLDRRIREHQQRIVVAGHSKENCPVCGSQILQDKWQELVASMKSEQAQLVSDLSDAAQWIRQHEKAKSPDAIREELVALRDKVSRIEVRRMTRQELVDRLVKVKAKRDGVMTEIAEELADLTQQTETVRSRLSAEVEIIERAIVKLKEEHARINAQLRERTNFLESRNTLEVARQEAEARLNESKAQAAETSFLVGALAPAGIPLMIVDHYLPIIESRARDLINQMSEGKLSLKMVVIEEGIKKGIEIMSGSNQMRPVRSLSGGEQTRVALAIRLALSQTLAEISGCRFDCFLCDEPQFLDPNGIEQFIQSINRLRGKFSQIFVMSHHAALQRAFPSVILVENVNDVSTAKVV